MITSEPRPTEKQSTSSSTLMAVWTGVGIVIILILGLLLGFVVVPILQTRAAVKRCGDLRKAIDYRVMEREIERLGGAEAAVPRLSRYLRLPRDLAPMRPNAARMLVECGRSALPDLRVCLTDKDKYIRRIAARALGVRKDRKAVTPLISMLDDEDRKARRLAVWALGEIGLSAREAIPALERLLRDNDSPEGLATSVEVLQALKKMGHHAVP